ncbi:MAG: hypothetical protein KGL39_20215 [Patescibacteria group bacterium]|nr:hypothetical protein [Patescibacteria group bacterium]
MPVSAELLAELGQLGFDLETVTLIVTLFERDASRDASRLVSRDGRDGKALAAERARKYRARKQNQSGMAGHVAYETSRDASRQTSRDERDGALNNLTSLSEVVVESKEETKKEDRTEVVEGRKSKRRTLVPLPADWQPSAMHHAAAKRLNLAFGVVEAKFEDMKIWAHSNDIRKANWDMTFHGFLRRVAAEGSKNGGENGSGIGAGRAYISTGPSSRQDAILTGMARYAERRFGNKFADSARDIPGSMDASGKPLAEPITAHGDRGSYPELKLIVQPDTRKQ